MILLLRDLAIFLARDDKVSDMEEVKSRKVACRMCLT